MAETHNSSSVDDDNCRSSTIIYREAVPKYGNYSKGRVLNKTISVDSEFQLEANQQNRKADITAQKCQDDHNFSSVTNVNKPVNVVDPLSVSTLESTLSESTAIKNLSQLSAISLKRPAPHLCLDLPMLGPDQGVRLMTYNEYSLLHHRLNRMETENKDLTSQLGRQHQVNTELKKLLVASLGDGLEDRINKLTRDKADLDAEVEHYSKQVSVDQETIDKMMIQADMWRSKFLASKMMSDEIARGRAMYAMSYKQSQNALLALLNERHELRVNLLQSVKNLERIQFAFDPLNTTPTDHNTTNITALSSHIAFSSNSIMYRLLPPSVAAQSNTSLQVVSDNLTRAEKFAQDIVSHGVDVSDMTAPYSPVMKHHPPPLYTIQRFNPDVKYDNLTYNCCSRCNGDILVM